MRVDPRRIATYRPDINRLGHVTDLGSALKMAVLEYEPGAIPVVDIDGLRIWGIHAIWSFIDDELPEVAAGSIQYLRSA